MFPAWAGRFTFGLVVTGMFGGLPIDSAVAARLFAAEAQEPDQPEPASTSGRPPGDGFFIDLREGLDRNTEYLSDFDFDADWVLMSFRDENVVFGADGMSLLAERTGTETMPYTTSEFQRQGFYGYGRYEVVMRPSAAKGIVSSFFIHTDQQFSDPHSEIDFEFVGKLPGEVHLNYYVDGKDNSVNVLLGFDASKSEHLYAFEWTPNSIAWYVDGVKVREVTDKTSPIGIPASSSRVIANTWTGNRDAEEWVGAPAFEKTSALYACISHVPAGKTGKQCSDVFTASKP